MTLKSQEAYVKAICLFIHSAPTERRPIAVQDRLSEHPINVPD
jgi:hypothetical protein